MRKRPAGISKQINTCLFFYFISGLKYILDLFFLSFTTSEGPSLPAHSIHSFHLEPEGNPHICHWLLLLRVQERIKATSDRAVLLLHLCVCVCIYCGRSFHPSQLNLGSWRHIMQRYSSSLGKEQVMSPILCR